MAEQRTAATKTRSPAESSSLPIGLVIHERLTRPRQLVRVALDQLCQRVDEMDTDSPAAKRTVQLLATALRTLLERQFKYEVEELTGIQFPDLGEMGERQYQILRRLRDVEQAIEVVRNIEFLLGKAEELRSSTSRYFSWMDGYFEK